MLSRRAQVTRAGVSNRATETKSRERFYDTIANEFDNLMHPFDLTRRKEAIFGRLLRNIPLAGRRAVDIGCGTGGMSVQARAEGALVTGVDVGCRLLEITRTKGITSVVQADALRLPFADESFDVVISSECIEHTTDGRQAVTEMLRIVRSGGYVALTCPNRKWRWLIVLATYLRLRPFAGIEEPPGWLELEDWVTSAGGAVIQHFGLHALPFQLPLADRFLPKLDSLLSSLDAGFINQCLLARKPFSEDAGSEEAVA